MLGAFGVRAETLEWVGPSGDAAPEGFVLTLLRKDGHGALLSSAGADVTCEGADLKPAPESTSTRSYLVVPRPGSRVVKVRASGSGAVAEASYPLGPPAARLELSLTPASPVKGVDSDAQLTVRVLKADGSVDPGSAPPVVRANVGSIEALTAVGAGTYRGRYVLPSTRYPEVAVVVALSAWPHPDSVHGAVGSLRVPLATAIDLPGKTERNSQMSIEIAGKAYGPVQSGPDGRFRVPVVVPPGHRFGKGVATDRAGNRRVVRVDLMLPPTDQLACVANPTRLPLQSTARSRVLCAASDEFGQPAARADVSLAARKGSVSGPKALGGGLYEWIYQAPNAPLPQAEVLLATWRQAGARSVEELSIDLVQGPMGSLTVQLPDPLVHPLGSVTLEAQVQDGLRRPRPGVTVAGEAPFGDFSSAVERGPGVFRLTWTAPEKAPQGPVRLAVRAAGPFGVSPAQLLAWCEPSPERGQCELSVGAVDIAGLAVPRQRLWVDGSEVVTGEDGRARVGRALPGRHEVRHLEWVSLRHTFTVLGGGVAFPGQRWTGTLTGEAAVEVGPALPVNVKLQISGAQVTYWAEDPRGAVLPERRLEVSLSSGSRGEVAQRAGKHSFRVRAREAVSVSVSDAETGVTAVGEVRP